MPGAYSQLLLHVVFSTKERKPWIADVAADRFDPNSAPSNLSGLRLSPFIGGSISSHISSAFLAYLAVQSPSKKSRQFPTEIGHASR
jgi:hypothetical protein